MPLWRCPHCATPQAETARCWVCHRSSTACGACRHFRRSVAAQLGYCGLDRQRTPLTGEEIRPCWEAVGANAAAIPALPGVGAVWPLGPDDDRTTVRRLDFVEVPPDPMRAGMPDPPDAAAHASAEDATETTYLAPNASGERRWSLWGESDI